jgi:ferritin
MLSESMQKAFNKQINEELFSAYLYLSMAAHFKAVNLKGFAHWMRAQSQEEVEHAMKFYDHINERGGRVTLLSLKEPAAKWDTPLAAFEAAYGHEQKITGLIHDLVDLAIDKRDHAANNFLQWFVEEQVEEEASTSEVVEQLKLVGDSPNGLFMIDRALGQRGE